MDLFPKRLSIIALALGTALCVGAATLIGYLHGEFRDLHHEQFPILERASINVRLLQSIDLQLQLALATRGTARPANSPNAEDELELNVNSLEDNLTHFEKSLEGNPRYAALLHRSDTTPVLQGYRSVLSALKQGHIEEALKRKDNLQEKEAAFASLVADLTESLSQERELGQERQLTWIRSIVAAFLLVSILIGVLCMRIYRSYQRNWLRRLEAEAQVASLSKQREQLIRVLCHDLANPVGSISGFVEFAEKKEGETRRKAFDMIRSSAAGAQAIIDSVRRMQALESGKLALEITPHGLAELVEESLTVLAARLSKKAITVAVEIDPTLKVQVERTSFINSVVNNVLTNAIKFSPDGARLEIRGLLLGDSRVELSVRDYGVGMPETIRRELFSETVTTSRRGTHGEEGTGFGLPLARKFVLAYGGDIQVLSTETPGPEQGTTVTLQLKAAA